MAGAALGARVNCPAERKPRTGAVSGVIRTILHDARSLVRNALPVVLLPLYGGVGARCRDGDTYGDLSELQGVRRLGGIR